MLYALFVLFVILMVLDGVTTYRAISKNKGEEWNPIMAFLFKQFGVIPALVATKGFAIAVVWMTMEPVWVLVALDALFVAVVWNNYRVAQ